MEPNSACSGGNVQSEHADDLPAPVSAYVPEGGNTNNTISESSVNSSQPTSAPEPTQTTPVFPLLPFPFPTVPTAVVAFEFEDAL